MQNPISRFSIIKTGSLSASQKEDVQQLAEVCCLHDRIRLSYPAGEVSGPGGDKVPDSSDAMCGGGSTDGGDAMHWLCCREDGLLCSALALVLYQDSPAECIAFTHPDFRHRGLFSRLFEDALEYCGDRDILFSVSGHCPGTAAALQALDAEPVSREHQMELDLGAEPEFTVCAPHPDAPSFLALRKARDNGGADSGETTWQLTCPAAPESSDSFSRPAAPGSSDSLSRPAAPGSSDGSVCQEILCGSCRTTMVSGSCSCLHHVEILTGLQRQGYGHAMICLLLPALYREGVRRVILQVSGDNEAALALYKKTGFRITETLSCYLY